MNQQKFNFDNFFSMAITEKSSVEKGSKGFLVQITQGGQWRKIDNNFIKVIHLKHRPTCSMV